NPSADRLGVADAGVGGGVGAERLRRVRPVAGAGAAAAVDARQRRGERVVRPLLDRQLDAAAGRPGAVVALGAGVGVRAGAGEELQRARRDRADVLQLEGGRSGLARLLPREVQQLVAGAVGGGIGA